MANDKMLSKIKKEASRMVLVVAAINSGMPVSQLNDAHEYLANFVNFLGEWLDQQPEEELGFVKGVKHIGPLEEIEKIGLAELGREPWRSVLK